VFGHVNIGQGDAEGFGYFAGGPCFLGVEIEDLNLFEAEFCLDRFQGCFEQIFSPFGFE